MSSIHAFSNIISYEHSPDSGYVLRRNTFQAIQKVKSIMFLSFYLFYFYVCCISCLASPSLNFISALTPQLPGCLCSSLAKVPFSRKKKKKNCFNLNFIGFWTQARSYFWYNPLPALFSSPERETLTAISCRAFEHIQITFTSGGEESKSSATDFMQMLFDTCLFLKGSLLYSLALSLKTSRTPAWVSLQQPF